MVSQDVFAEATRILLGMGFRFTVIGGTIVSIYLGLEDLGDDVDVFAEHPSVLLEEDRYYKVALENSWNAGQTWLGTPRILVRVGDEEVPFEFYDNLYDFYVPENMVGRSRRVDVGGVRVKMLSLEDHIVLKANAGRSLDMERLREIGRLAKRKGVAIKRARLLEAARLFEDERVILRRLKDSGLL